MKPKCLTLLSFCIMFFAQPSWASRTVTDQLGRHVTVPDKVDRVVVLQHQTLDILLQLGAQDSLVGVLSSWKRHLGSEFLRLDPNLSKLPMPGDLTQVNIESLLALKPQVVFVTNYLPASMLQQLQATGIPIVAISLRQYKAGQASKMNASMDNAEQVYNQGLQQGIRLIGHIVNRERNAERLIKSTFSQRSFVAQQLRDLSPSERKRVYIANPHLATYGSGKYTGLMLEHAGAINVAASSIKGYQQVSIEQVMAWNPQVILVQHRYAEEVEKIQQDPRWQGIDAVKHKRIYLMPEYAKAWGYPTPEAMALGELWLAKTLYPVRFTGVQMNKVANRYYQAFYQHAYRTTSGAQ